ncbi:MAG: glutaredoxin 3 [Pseudomonadota bacterium]
MPDITIYTAMLCPFCTRAKKLLRDKGAEFKEIDVTARPKLRAEMREKAGGVNSVPQIWIDDRHVGGCDDLYALEAKGELNGLLAPGGNG